MKQVKFILCDCSTIGAAVDVRKPENQQLVRRVSTGVLGYTAPLHLLLCFRGHAKKNSTETEPEPRPCVEDFQKASRCMFQRLSGETSDTIWRTRRSC